MNLRNILIGKPSKARIAVLWECFDVWNSTARTGSDKRHALRTKTKALIMEDQLSVA